MLQRVLLFIATAMIGCAWAADFTVDLSQESSQGNLREVCLTNRVAGCPGVDRVVVTVRGIDSAGEESRLFRHGNGLGVYGIGDAEAGQHTLMDLGEAVVFGIEAFSGDGVSVPTRLTLSTVELRRGGDPLLKSVWYAGKEKPDSIGADADHAFCISDEVVAAGIPAGYIYRIAVDGVRDAFSFSTADTLWMRRTEDGFFGAKSFNLKKVTLSVLPEEG